MNYQLDTCMRETVALGLLLWHRHTVSTQHNILFSEKWKIKKYISLRKEILKVRYSTSLKKTQICDRSCGFCTDSQQPKSLKPFITATSNIHQSYILFLSYFCFQVCLLSNSDSSPPPFFFPNDKIKELKGGGYV